MDWVTVLSNTGHGLSIAQTTISKTSANFSNKKLKDGEPNHSIFLHQTIQITFLSFLNYLYDFLKCSFMYSPSLKWRFKSLVHSYTYSINAFSILLCLIILSHGPRIATYCSSFPSLYIFFRSVIRPGISCNQRAFFILFSCQSNL